MNRRDAWAMGARLALLGSRSRLTLTAGGVSLGVALLLGVLSVLPAYFAHQDRGFSRVPTSASAVGPEWAPTPAATGDLVLEQVSTYWRGHEVTVMRVVGTGVAPPGVRALPAEGEAVLSPALAAALAGPRGSELSPRVPGRQVSTIGDRGLVGPDELLAYVGTARSAVDPQLPAVTGYGSARSFAYVGDEGAVPALATVGFRGAPVELRYAVLLGALALLLPIGVLVATATRLSAALRDRRLASLRLVGATPRQVRWMAAGEAGAAGALGTLAGVVLFVLLRGPVASLVPLGTGVFASDLTPSPVLGLLALLAVPAVATVAGVLSLRRVVTSPLGVSRQARVRGARWVRLVPLAVGLLMLGGFSLRAQLDRALALEGVLLLGGGALTIVGLALAAPALARLGGTLLVRLPGVSSQLAGRQVLADPGASARTVTGSALAVFVIVWLLAFLPLIPAANSGYLTPLADTLRPATVVFSSPGDVTDPRDVPGVLATATLGEVRGLPPGTNPQDPAAERSTTSVLVGDCAALSAVLRTPLQGCTSGQSYLLDQSYGDGTTSRDSPYRPMVPEQLVLLGPDGVPDPARTLEVPSDLPHLVLPPGLDSTPLRGSVLVPRVTGPVDHTTVLATTDGEQASIEALRSALATPGPGYVLPLTIAEKISRAEAPYDGYSRAALLGGLLAVLVGAASLTVTTVDGLRSRRRAMAALVALGTPVGVLRRSVLLTVAAPLLLTVGVALGAGALAALCYLEGGYASYTLPWGSWSVTGASALVAVLLATAAGLPLVSAAARPDALRAE